MYWRKAFAFIPLNSSWKETRMQREEAVIWYVCGRNYILVSFHSNQSIDKLIIDQLTLDEYTYFKKFLLDT